MRNPSCSFQISTSYDRQDVPLNLPGAKCFVRQGGIPIKPCDEQTLGQLVFGSSSEYRLCGFGGCYWKPWLQALIFFYVYFILPPFFFFFWRPSHDNAVGITDQAGQKFHRSTAYCQGDGQVTQKISLVCKIKQYINSITKIFVYFIV